MIYIYRQIYILYINIYIWRRLIINIKYLYCKKPCASLCPDFLPTLCPIFLPTLCRTLCANLVRATLCRHPLWIWRVGLAKKMEYYMKNTNFHHICQSSGLWGPAKYINKSHRNLHFYIIFNGSGRPESSQNDDKQHEKHSFSKVFIGSGRPGPSKNI